MHKTNSNAGTNWKNITYETMPLSLLAPLGNLQWWCGNKPTTLYGFRHPTRQGLYFQRSSRGGRELWGYGTLRGTERGGGNGDGEERGAQIEGRNISPFERESLLMVWELGNSRRASGGRRGMPTKSEKAQYRLAGRWEDEGGKAESLQFVLMGPLPSLF